MYANLSGVVREFRSASCVNKETCRSTSCISSNVSSHFCKSHCVGEFKALEKISARGIQPNSGDEFSGIVCGFDRSLKRVGITFDDFAGQKNYSLTILRRDALKGRCRNGRWHGTRDDDSGNNSTNAQNSDFHCQAPAQATYFRSQIESIPPGKYRQL